MPGILLVQGCVLRSPNCPVKDTTEPKKNITVHYDWPLLNNRDIGDKYALTLSNKDDALQEIPEAPTPNDEYEKFANSLL